MYRVMENQGGNDYLHQREVVLLLKQMTQECAEIIQRRIYTGT